MKLTASELYLILKKEVGVDTNRTKIVIIYQMNTIEEKKKKLITEFRVNSKDTGSSSVQIAVLTEQIANLSEHLKKNPKDFASQRGLLRMVSQRRKLLDYLAKQDENRYQKIVQRLELRK